MRHSTKGGSQKRLSERLWLYFRDVPEKSFDRVAHGVCGTHEMCLGICWSAISSVAPAFVVATNGGLPESEIAEIIVDAQAISERRDVYLDDRICAYLRHQ